MGLFSVDFQRRVKNVGLANSTYKVEVKPDSKLDVKVVSEVLFSKYLTEEKTWPKKALLSLSIV